MKRPLAWIVAAVALVVSLAAVAATPPNLSRAVAEQRRLAAERPGEPAVFNDLGNLLILAGDSSGAEEAYRRALELAPELASARFNLGLLLQQEGREDEARSEYRRVIDQVPDHAWAHYQIGSLYELAGNERQAVRWYGRAFSLEPRLAFSEYNPSVIENKLVEKAMLEGYRADSRRPLAPKLYEDPGRIADLLVPPPVGPAADEEGGDEPVADDEGSAEAEAMDEEPAGRPVAEVGGARLDAGDLDSRAVNQASPRGSSGSRYQPPAQPRVRTWSRSQQQDDAASRGRATGGRVGGSAGAVVIQGGSGGQPTLEPSKTQPSPGVAPGGRVRFRPGTASTGRLELQLLPADPGADTAERPS